MAKNVDFYNINDERWESFPSTYFCNKRFEKSLRRASKNGINGKEVERLLSYLCKEGSGSFEPASDYSNIKSYRRYHVYLKYDYFRYNGFIVEVWRV